MRTACGWEWLNEIKYKFVLGIVERLRLACGWEVLYVAKEDLGRRAGRTSTGGIQYIGSRGGLY